MNKPVRPGLPQTDGLEAWAHVPSAWAEDQEEVKEVLAAPDASLQNYTVLCYGALVVIAFVLLRRGPSLWSLFPVLVGVLGVLFRWRITPVLMLFVLASCLFANDSMHLAPGENAGYMQPRRFEMTTWIVSGAILAYVAGHYRLQALSLSIFPPDRRRKYAQKQGLSLPVSEPRLPATVPPNEIGWLALSLPAWALLAFFLWRSLPVRMRAWDLLPIQWNLTIMLWGFGVTLFVAAGILGYLGHRRLTRRQARIYLQEVAWAELGGEQQRIERFRGRSRSRQRKEYP